MVLRRRNLGVPSPTGWPTLIWQGRGVVWIQEDQVPVVRVRWVQALPYHTLENDIDFFRRTLCYDIIPRSEEEPHEDREKLSILLGGIHGVD